MTNANQNTSANVTMEDVKNAIGTGDPSQTNASKIRQVLGRGSMQTIQKFLDVLRAELSTPESSTQEQIPDTPSDLVRSVWVAAWTTASLQNQKRTEQLSTERDTALSRLQTTAADVIELTLTADQLAEQLQTAAAELQAEREAHQAAVVAAKSGEEAAAAALTAAAADTAAITAELTKVKSDAVHAAQLAEAGRELLREELSRLTDQIGELKAALYSRSVAA